MTSNAEERRAPHPSFQRESVALVANSQQSINRYFLVFTFKGSLSSPINRFFCNATCLVTLLFACSLEDVYNPPLIFVFGILAWIPAILTNQPTLYVGERAKLASVALRTVNLEAKRAVIALIANSLRQQVLPVVRLRRDADAGGYP